MPRYLWLALGLPLMAAIFMGLTPATTDWRRSLRCESRPEKDRSLSVPWQHKLN